METRVAMTPDEIKTKLVEVNSKRVELETTLAKISKDAALAMVAGENMNKYEENRLKTAEEVRHLSEFISGLEQALVDAEKQKDIDTLEIYLLRRKETKPLCEAAQNRLESAKAELKAAQTAKDELDETWSGAGRVIEAYRDKLKKKHKMLDIEINQIESKFKND